MQKPPTEMETEWAEANFLWGARLNKKNEIMKILQILEIFTK